MIKVHIGNGNNNKKVLEKGKYPFQILSVNERVSKAGNNMFEIWLEENKSRIKVRDFFPLIESWEEKLKNFLKAIGQPCEGELTLEGAEWIGLWVICDIDIKEYTKKSGAKGRNNTIVAYEPMPKDTAEGQTDDVPF